MFLKQITSSATLGCRMGVDDGWEGRLSFGRSRIIIVLGSKVCASGRVAASQMLRWASALCWEKLPKLNQSMHPWGLWLNPVAVTQVSFWWGGAAPTRDLLLGRCGG
eukprot:scaffold4410_cov153-Pinguiococcus_pyrenoidosus.AAC.1